MIINVFFKRVIYECRALDITIGKQEQKSRMMEYYKAQNNHLKIVFFFPCDPNIHI